MHPSRGCAGSYEVARHCPTRHRYCVVRQAEPNRGPGHAPFDGERRSMREPAMTAVRRPKVAVQFVEAGTNRLEQGADLAHLLKLGAVILHQPEAHGEDVPIGWRWAIGRSSVRSCEDLPGIRPMAQGNRPAICGRASARVRYRDERPAREPPGGRCHPAADEHQPACRSRRVALPIQGLPWQGTAI
jgi:hypothetical protein